MSLLAEFFDMNDVDTCIRQIRNLCVDLSIQQGRSQMSILIALGYVAERGVVDTAETANGGALVEMGKSMVRALEPPRQLRVAVMPLPGMMPAPDEEMNEPEVH